ncbi:MAG: cadmium-translocating P-type ATPase [Clostridia bacterium]|nr:cadmium-translocating P-type ATPase [Clostridia bacterium]
MKKTFILKGLDCPHCSAEIEREVGELESVSVSEVNLMKQTLTVNINSDKTQQVTNQIKAIVNSHEPDVEVFEYSDKEKGTVEADANGKIIMRLITGAVLFLIYIVLGNVFTLPKTAELIILLTAYVILGADVVLKAVKNIVKGRVFDENFLMSISTVGAFLIGENLEAVAVMLFYQVGEFFQELSVKRSRKSITELMDIRPDFAAVIRNGTPIVVSPEAVAVGEVITVKAGERIPLDGIVIEGSSFLDTRALTGEAVPEAVGVGDEVLSGCINQNGVLSIKVSREFGESTASKIIDLVENASSRKAPTESFITKFARYYTPAVVIFAALLGFVPPIFFGDFAEWIHRSLVFLVISCPCALVLSIPLAFFSGIGAASKRGVLVKGSNYLEALNNISTVVFDKTGTLTKGVFSVTEIIPSVGFTEEQVLEFAAKAESFSNHPIAKSVLKAYGKETENKAVGGYNEISGCGIAVNINGKNVFVGNDKLMKAQNIDFKASDKAGTKVYVAVESEYVGCILITDIIKNDSKQAVADLKRSGVQKAVMLTGDNQSIAKSVAEELLLDEYYAELLPDEKVEKLELLESQNRKGGKLAFVGDGINDAPVLARADIGIAMGGIGSDAAIEAADVVLMTDEPSKLVEAVRVAKYTKSIVIQNIIISLSVKGIFLVLGAFGIAGMWEAVFSDVGVALIAVLNSMRALKK